MNVDEFFEVFTGGNHYTATWKPRAIKDFAEDYHKQRLRLHGVSNWLACKDKLPEHGETVLTYTPLTEMASEQIRLMKYGTLKSGFPAGITHWQKINKPTCY